MPVIDYIDGANRDIYLHADTVGSSVHPMDIYREMRALRRTDESLRKWNLFIAAFGNVPKGGGKFTERYIQLLEGTRIIPYDISHALTVTGTIITDDGQEGVACFDRTPLSGSTVVDINYVPPQVEVITVSSGSGLDAAQNAKLTAIDSLVDELHRIHGLNNANPVTTTPTSRATTGITQTISGDGETTSTITRI